MSSPKHQVLATRRDPDTRRTLAALDCGHELPMRTAWPGKWRWCSECNPPTPTPTPPLPDIDPMTRALYMKRLREGHDPHR